MGYSGIKEVAEATSAYEANERLLKEGWKLLEVCEVMGFTVEGNKMVRRSRIVHVLGKRG